MRITLSLVALLATPGVAIAETTLRDLSEGQLRSEVLEPGLTMHTYLSRGLPGGAGSVNSHIFESDTAIWLFDAQFYKTAALELREILQEIDKPIVRISVSHAHPDHAFGAAWLDDLAPISASAAVAAEAAGAFPFFEQMMVQQMGAEAASALFPIGDLPQITEILPAGTVTFGPTDFVILDLPSHEVGTETFVHIPEHGLLMVFDSIMPNAHQLVFPQPGASFDDRLHTGFDMLDALEALAPVERMVFGHNSIAPLPAAEQFAFARQGLEIYGTLAEQHGDADGFIAGAAEARPDWEQFYVPLTAGALYPAN